MKSQLLKILFCSAFFCCLLIGTAALAQSSRQVDTTFSYNMNRVFGHLDKNKIPYGLLRDYAIELTNLENYDGSALTDSNKVDKGILREMYMSLATSRLTPAAITTLPGPGKVDSLWQVARKQGQVTLCGLFYKYAYLSSTAVSGGKITVTNNQLYDKYVGGVWQNPYLQAQTAGFAPSIEVYNSKSFNILLPANLWLSNSKSQVNHIEIDANDGSGYRTLTPGTVLPVSYADTGLKAWNFKIFLTNSTVLQCHTQIKVNGYQRPLICDSGGCGPYSPPGGGTQAIPANGQAAVPADVITGSNPYYFNTGETFGGSSAQGMVTIRFAPGHNTSLINPLIVAEGFDPGIYTSPENAGGSYSLNEFINSTNESSTLSNFINSNYDIVFIDYHDGTDDIRRNALLVKSVIRWVNANKTGSNKNVVLGLSMGGLVARYALKKMENAGEMHNVRLFINHGGPQLGADVPLGLQYLETDVNTLYLRAGAGATVYDIIRLFEPKYPIIGGVLTLSNTIAARQMLISHINTNFQIDNTAHASWQTELTALGYPAACRNVAISNGSECGQAQSIGQNGQLFYLDGKINTAFLGDLVSALGSPFAAGFTGQGSFLLGVLPGRNDIFLHYTANSGKDGGGNQIYNGKITYKKTILYVIPVTTTLTSRSYNGPSGVLPYESFPGDYYAIQPIPSALTSSGWFGKYNITLNIANSFGFIPTASVLDIGKGSTSLTESDFQSAYSRDHPPVSPKNTPFVNFVTAYNQGPANEEHISYEDRNGTWLVNELNNQPVTTGCSVLCQASQIIGTDQPVCSSATYSITSAIPANAISWSVYPSGIVSLNSSGNSVTVTRIANGSVTLTANINTSALCATAITKRINIGIPAAGPIIGTQSVCIRDADSYTYLAPNVDNATAWYWSTYPTTSFINANGTSSATIGFNVVGNYSIECDITTPCGIAQAFGYVSARDCSLGPNFLIYPNPADNNMSIIQQTNSPSSPLTTSSSNVSQAHQINLKKPYTYKLYNKKGQILKQGQSTDENVLNINTTDLPNDNYFLHIIMGDDVLKKQIIISHP